jgi:hypothetical protein
MLHEVCDVSEEVHKLYNYMDPVALENMVVEVSHSVIYGTIPYQ